MIDGLKPYPAMKDSGQPWLGEVPEHWTVASLRHFITVRSGDAPQRVEHEGGPYAVFGANGIIGRCSAFNSKDPRVVVGRVGSAGAVNVTPREVWITDNVLIVDPRSRAISFDFLPRLLTALDLPTLTSQSAQPLITGGQIKARIAALPPLPEQTAIVRFLDHADRRIRRYIRAKQKLIKLLEELKQAIIHRAVTRGVNPNVRLKPSGVEWLGEVPEHWEELPLKRVSRLDNSGNYGVEPEQGEEVLPVATTAQIDRAGRFDFAHMPKRGFSPADIARYGCRPGDILVVKSSGSIFNVISGKAGLVRPDAPPFVFSNFLMRVVADPAVVEAEYLFLLLSGYLTRERVKRMVAGTTYPNLRVGEYVSALVPVPPILEQRSITSAVSLMTAAADHAVRSAQTDINLCREYRTRLIADVVTGKLDVRDAAARLPDEAEGAEPLDEIESEAETDETGAADANKMPEEAEG